jgi:hypothetical protein
MESLPLVVVYVLGLAFALMQMQRLPRVAAAAGGGFGALLLLLMVRPMFTSVIFRALRRDPDSLSVLMTLTGFVFTLLTAVAMGAVAFAIFVDRPEVQLPFNRPSSPQQPGYPPR